MNTDKGFRNLVPLNKSASGFKRGGGGGGLFYLR